VPLSSLVGGEIKRWWVPPIFVLSSLFLCWSKQEKVSISLVSLSPQSLSSLSLINQAQSKRHYHFDSRLECCIVLYMEMLAQTCQALIGLCPAPQLTCSFTIFVLFIASVYPNSETDFLLCFFTQF
jgi:predicted DNA repair protein MutK